MSKKQLLSCGSSRSRRASRKRKLAAAITLVLICVVGTSLLAQGNLRSKSKKPSGEVSVMSVAGPPSKEYIWAGSKLISTVEPTAVNGNDGQFVSWSYREPCTNIEGNPPGWLPIGLGSFGLASPQEYSVRVTMKNTGSATWTVGSYYLGSQNPANNITWGTGTDRIALPASVPQNGTITFEFSVKRPATGPNPFNFQWQMVGPSGYFGEKTKNVVIPNGAWLCQGTAADSATFVSQTVPSLMLAGKTYPVGVTMNNGGTTTWTAAANYKLGSQLPQDNTYWGTNRVAVPSSTSPGSNAVFNFNAIAPATPGVYNFQWMMVQDGGAGFFGYLTPGVRVAVNKKAALGYLDFDNDGKADIATWRSLDIKWRLDYNLDGIADVTQQFYNSRTDVPCPADYDGDGKADFAVIRPLSGQSAYYLDLDRNGFPDTNYPLWQPPGTVPVPGDYDGDGRADPAVYNSATGQWSVDTAAHNATTGLTVTFGVSGDIPVPADYNRDGRTDVAVFRPSTGQWFIDTDRNGVADLTITFGQNGDIPVPMDYNGDGIADLAVFRPSTGTWFIDTNLDGSADIVVGFGVNGDIPVAGDYNGDGKTDIAVFRPSSSQWFIDTNADGVADITVTFGAAGYTPLRQNGWILKAMGILPQ